MSRRCAFTPAHLLEKKGSKIRFKYNRAERHPGPELVAYGELRLKLAERWRCRQLAHTRSERDKKGVAQRTSDLSPPQFKAPRALNAQRLSLRSLARRSDTSCQRPVLVPSSKVHPKSWTVVEGNCPIE
jgi:hypothetical protein